MLGLASPRRRFTTSLKKASSAAGERFALNISFEAVIDELAHYGVHTNAGRLHLIECLHSGEAGDGAGLARRSFGFSGCSQARHPR